MFSIVAGWGFEARPIRFERYARWAHGPYRRAIVLHAVITEIACEFFARIFRSRARDEIHKVLSEQGLKQVLSLQELRDAAERLHVFLFLRRICSPDNH